MKLFAGLSLAVLMFSEGCMMTKGVGTPSDLAVPMEDSSLITTDSDPVEIDFMNETGLGGGSKVNN